MKKLTAAIMCVCCVFLSCSVCFGVNAVPLSAGTDALNESMLDGECPGRA